MDRITMNVLIFQRVENNLELLSELPLDDDLELVPVVLPLAA